MPRAISFAIGAILRTEFEKPRGTEAHALSFRPYAASQRSPAWHRVMGTGISLTTCCGALRSAEPSQDNTRASPRFSGLSSALPLPQTRSSLDRCWVLNSSRATVTQRREIPRRRGMLALLYQPEVISSKSMGYKGEPCVSWPVHKSHFPSVRTSG